MTARHRPLPAGEEHGTDEAFARDPRTKLVVTTSAGLEAEARQEIRRALPGAEVRPLLFKGNLLVLAALGESEAVVRLREADTRVLARAVPVQARVRLTADATCFPAVAEAAAGLGRIQPGDVFLVRATRRGRHEWHGRDLERAAAAAIEQATGATGDYEREADWLVSVQAYQDLAFVGVNHPANLVKKALRRQRKYAPGERPLNRAQWKLREALDAFGIDLAPGSEALDLGSAPGGWALALAERGCRVTAVDPAALDEAAAGHPNVTHLRERAEDLAERASWRERFDLLTCDMNTDPAEAARALCALAPMLKPGAPAIMTVKFPTRRRKRHEMEAREALAGEFEGIEMRRMPHNARETTAVMWRKGGAENAPK